MPPEPTPTSFIQWKGTDVCIDLHCTCGHQDHFDGYFLYAWRCPACSRIWEMASSVPMSPARANCDIYVELTDD